MNTLASESDSWKQGYVEVRTAFIFSPITMHKRVADTIRNTVPWQGDQPESQDTLSRTLLSLSNITHPHDFLFIII